MAVDYSAEHWAQAPALYDEHTLKIDGCDVMEDWESGYMERLAATATQNGGAILELGYGMGISAAAVQSHDIDTHTIIECHPDVIMKCVSSNRPAFEQGRMRLYTGFWQNVTPTLADETFDGILFDTYPIKDEEFIGPHMWFFSEAYRLMKVGAILTYYSDEATEISAQHVERLVDAGFDRSKIDYEVCDVNPPENCEYWRDPTIVVPIVRK
ncbi:class I SAM-dependent methyltransferase [Candidatus Saccharibacteria bacterium]|nr:class I SAM-dependent methyltransferase [Candidatus Saccharibacteria bacterium]